jgi:spermidine synthase
MPFQILLAVTVLISSACGLIIEIVAGRLIAPIFGMSLYTWTSIIAVVLAGLSIGHWIGGQLTKGTKPQIEQCNKIAYALILSSLSSLLILLLLDYVPGLAHSANLSVINSILAATTGLFFLPSLFVGIVSPLATKLAIDLANGDNSGVVIGRMYALGSAGAILGALLAGYFLISTLGSRNTIMVVAGLYFTLGVAFLLLSGHVRKQMLFVSVLLGVGMVSAVQISGGLNSRCYVESDYFCIQVQNVGRVGSEVRLVALDHLVHSINDKEQPELLHSPYVHFVDEYVEKRFGTRAMSAFFIGGGGFSLPRAWISKYHGVASLTVAEIDPRVTAVAKEMLWFVPDAKNTILLQGDARYELNMLPENQRFDIVFGDAFHDISIPAHLVTREFNDLIAARLHDDGIYVVNVVDNSRSPRFLMSLVKTLRRSFPEVEVWFEPDPSQQGSRSTFVVVAAKTPIDEDVLYAKRGFERSWWRWPQNRLEKAIQLDSFPVLTDDRAPVDQLMRNMLLSELS